jgi:GntR family transcriptional regulator/MocR family aminotransferase
MTMKLGLTPMLDSSNDTPLYVQLYQYIRQQIETGAIQTDSSLPSIRQLAQHLEISKNTVETSYQQLLAEGYIQSRERSGYKVQPLDEWSRSSAAVTARSADKAAARATAQPSRYNFQYGNVDLSRFPLEAWRKCMAEALAAPAQELLGYGDRQGHSALKEEIASLVYQARSVACRPDQIIICAGTQHAVSLLCQLLSLAGSDIAIEDPGYDGVKVVFRNFGCRLHPIELEADGLSIEQLKQTDARIVYVTPSHQFPLGMVLPVQKRIQLLQWAAECEGYIIEDDYDSEFRYKSKPIPALKALDKQERVIYLGTLSKSFLPAIRLSYLIMPEQLLGKVETKLEQYSQAVSPFIQQALWLFMQQGNFARHVRRMKRLYQSKHRVFIHAIELYMGERVSIIGDHSGLHLLLDVNNRSCDELIALAAQAGCTVYSPRKHWLDPEQCPDSYIMLGFGGLAEEELVQGIKQLARVWFPAEIRTIF